MAGRATRSAAHTGPLRTCIGCRRVAGPDELVRVARGAHGELLVGPTHPGRGAWLCVRSPPCVALAEQRGAFARALRAPVDGTAIASLRAGLARAAEIGAEAATFGSGTEKHARIRGRRSSSRKD